MRCGWRRLSVFYRSDGNLSPAVLLVTALPALDGFVWVSFVRRNRQSFLVVRQNFSRGPKRGGSGGVGVNTIIDSVQQEDPKRASPVRVDTGRKSIRTMPLDCNDGAALRVAPVKGPHPNLRNEFCAKVSPFPL